MTFNTLLKNTISSTFDLYRDHSRTFYGFSFGFTVLSIILSGIMASLTCLVADFFYGFSESVYSSSFFEKILFQPYTYSRLTELTVAYSVFFIALYAVYLKNYIPGTKAGMAGFFKSISDSLFDFVIVIVIYTIIFLLLFKDFFASRHFDFTSGNYTSVYLAEWVNQFAILLRTFLPFFGGYYIITGNFQILNKKAAYAILSIILLSIVLNAFSSQLVWYLNHLILMPVGSLFRDSYIPLVFIITAALFFCSWFALGLAACMHYPVALSEIERKKPADPNLLDSAEPIDNKDDSEFS